LSIIAISFIVALGVLFVYVKNREAFDEQIGYNGNTLIIGDAPDYFNQSGRLAGGDVCGGSIVKVYAEVEARNPDGTFAKGHKPVGVVHGKGGKFVSAKAA
jgi:hypothetical protein